MASFAEANAAIAMEKAGMSAVHGLGAGGNVPEATSVLAQAAARSQQKEQQQPRVRLVSPLLAAHCAMDVEMIYATAAMPAM